MRAARSTRTGATTDLATGAAGVKKNLISALGWVELAVFAVILLLMLVSFH